MLCSGGSSPRGGALSILVRAKTWQFLLLQSPAVARMDWVTVPSLPKHTCALLSEVLDGWWGVAHMEELREKQKAGVQQAAATMASDVHGLSGQEGFWGGLLASAKVCGF